MTQSAEKLLDQAMSLNEAERAELAARLIETLDAASDSDYATAWQAEIEQRLGQLDAGKAKAIPWDEARRQIRGGGDRTGDDPG